MNDKDTLQITETNLVTFLTKIEEAVHNGFSIIKDGWEAPSHLTFCFTANLERDVPVQEAAKKPAGRPPKAKA